jgi:hypothetical protein
MKPYSGADPGSIQSVVSRADGGGVKTLITALEQFGRVSSSYSTVVVTTNRQPVPFGVQNTEAYLASVTAGTINATTGVSTGATLTASSVSQLRQLQQEQPSPLRPLVRLRLTQ